MTDFRNATAQEGPEPRSAGWRSWHLHTATFGMTALDDVVTEALGPLAGRLGLLEPDGPPWFFLRYWQGGPHLRLRIAGLTQSEADRIETELAGRLDTLDAVVPPGQRLDQDSYARAVRPLATAGEAGVSLPVGHLVAPGIRRAVYEPEYRRYGGPHLIGRSEHLFHCSSRTALRVCLARAGTRHGTASGLEATAAACSVLDEHRTPVDRVRFLEGQRDVWLGWARSGEAAEGGTVDGPRGEPADTARSRVAALGGLGPRLLAAMAQGDPRWAAWTDPLGEALSVWTSELGPARAVGIFGSHVHMTANRLGVGAGREARIAALLLALLESTPAAQAAD